MRDMYQPALSVLWQRCLPVSHFEFTSLSPWGGRAQRGPRRV